jgi:hypothetical protein
MEAKRARGTGTRPHGVESSDRAAATHRRAKGNRHSHTREVVAVFTSVRPVPQLPPTNSRFLALARITESHEGTARPGKVSSRFSCWIGLPRSLSHISRRLAPRSHGSRTVERPRTALHYTRYASHSRPLTQPTRPPRYLASRTPALQRGPRARRSAGTSPRSHQRHGAPPQCPTGAEGSDPRYGRVRPTLVARAGTRPRRRAPRTEQSRPTHATRAHVVCVTAHFWAAGRQGPAAQLRIRCCTASELVTAGSEHL